MRMCADRTWGQIMYHLAEAKCSGQTYAVWYCLDASRRGNKLISMVHDLLPDFALCWTSKRRGNFLLHWFIVWKRISVMNFNFKQMMLEDKFHNKLLIWKFSFQQDSSTLTLRLNTHHGPLPHPACYDHLPAPSPPLAGGSWSEE